MNIRRRIANIVLRDYLSTHDVQELNQVLVDDMRRQPLGELQKRVDRVTAGKQSRNEMSDILRTNGIVVVPEFLDAITSEGLSDDLSALDAEARQNLAHKSTYETDECCYNRDNAKFRSYNELAAYSKPVVQVRQGQDEGMVDIFNVDRLIAGGAGSIDERFESSGINDIVTTLEPGVRPGNINAYINKGITKTRGFHVDAYKPRYKAFIYLEDVNDLSAGPYTFVTGSNRPSAYRKANQKLALGLGKGTECPVVDVPNIIPVLGSKGTLIVSDQSGMHRGFPQSRNGSRKALVVNYREK